MRILLVLSLLSLTACGGSGSTEEVPVKPQPVPPVYEITVDSSNNISTWYSLGNINGVPKYSGAFGTYTHKHIPVAVSKSSHTFEVYSNNTGGTNKIYIIKDGQEPVYVDTMPTDDPHTNAIIFLSEDGRVNVVSSSRSQKIAGFWYKSKTPYELDFELVKKHYMSYPQAHIAPWGETIMHSHYGRYDGFYGREIRMNGELVVEGGHYQVSTMCGGKLYTAYNNHPKGSVDNRTDLYLLNFDGEKWNTNYGPIETPVISEEPFAKVYDTDLTTYVKEIKCFGDDVRVLFTESDSADPTQGQRFLKEYSLKTGNVATIIETHHNYAAAAYVDGVILVGVNGGDYVAGDIVVIKDGKVVATEYGEYSYIRPIIGGVGAVVSSGSSVTDTGAYHHRLHIKQ